jgi:hypothetical protein
MSCHRRAFLALGLQLPVAIVVGKASAECVDLDDLSDSIASMRESLDYTDTAPDPQQACKGCEYFRPAQPGDSCGHCAVLTSPVSATGHCVSWTKRRGA